MTEPPDFDPTALLRALTEHGVRFVLIGGFAAVFHGSPLLTSDLDVTPEPSRENLERLSAALTAVEAKIRTEGRPHRFKHDAASLARTEMWNLTTPHGDLDVSFRPAGTQGYPDLHRDATRARVLGIEIEVASLADVIRSKEAADRPKDRATLPGLRRLLEEQGG